MVASLAEAEPSFSGAANQVRCFAHIVNLVAKTILRQFEIVKPNSKSKDGRAGGAVDAEGAEEVYVHAAENAMLAEILAGVNLEGAVDEEDNVDGLDVDDDVDGWVDEREDLTQEEREELRESVLPVKLVLAKVT